MDPRVFGVICAAALVRGTFGFGDALLAMPLLLMLGIGKDASAPLVALVSVVIAGIVLVQDRRSIHLRDAALLIVPALAGIVVGLLFLAHAEERLVMGLLGGVIVLFSSYALLRPDTLHLVTDRTAPLFGVVAGVLSGAYNAPGPPLVMYGALRRWNAEQFRATAQAFFLPTSLVVVTGHGVAGRLTGDVFEYFAFALPLVLISVLAGGALNRRFRTESFGRWLHALLVILGIALIAQSLPLVA